MTRENLLSTYYQGIAQRVRAEVDFINGVLEHQGLKGEGNEAVLRDLIRKFIPERYGVGTGVVIDRHGTPSRQCDIVIYDKTMYPGLLALGSVHLYPVDLVYGVVEVKTTLDAKEAAGAIENIRSVRSLDIINEEFIMARNMAVTPQRPIPPIGFVFAFNSTAKDFSTFHKWFVPDDPEERKMYPGLVGCLDQGMVRFDPIDQSPSCKSWGIACVLTDDDGRPEVVGSNVERTVVGGAHVPVKSVEGRRFAIDQGQVLLTFLLLLTETLAAKHLNPELRFSQHYLHGSLDRSVLMKL